MGFVMGSIVNQDPNQFGQAATTAGQNPGGLLPHFPDLLPEEVHYKNRPQIFCDFTCTRMLSHALRVPWTLLQCRSSARVLRA